MVTGKFPAQSASKGKMFLFDDVIMQLLIWDRYSLNIKDLIDCLIAQFVLTIPDKVYMFAQNI